VKRKRLPHYHLEGQGVCLCVRATTGLQKKHVEQKAPGQPGDMRAQGPRARPGGSQQTLLRVQPTRGDLHRHHRGLLRMHVMLWNAVSGNVQLHAIMSRISLVAFTKLCSYNAARVWLCWFTFEIFGIHYYFVVFRRVPDSLARVTFHFVMISGLALI